MSPTDKPTAKQLAHLRQLAARLSQSFAYPQTRAQASAEIQRLRSAQRGRDAGELYRKTSGNPFFVTEALAASDLAIPTTVRDAVLARASRLGEAARTVLDAVAVVPPRAEVWLLGVLAPEAVDRIEECVSSGMLVAGPGWVAFRHELARLAVEESLPPDRRIALHRKALGALADPQAGVVDLARVAHHAEAAGDADAVLRFAPAAAARAASLGAHREAAAEYARALRFRGGLPQADSAELFEGRAHECFLTDQNPEAIDAVTAALELYQGIGDRLREGNARRSRSEILWCPGRVAECMRDAEEAVSVLEELRPGRELGLAYSNLSTMFASAEDNEQSVVWGTRALELGRTLGAEDIVTDALINIGAAGALDGAPGGLATLEDALELAERAGLDSQAGRAYIGLVSIAVDTRNYALLDRHLAAGIGFCSQRGLELHRLYLIANRARAELDTGRWTDAVNSAAAVLRVPRASTTPRIMTLVILALVRARRGDPQVWDPLDEAWALAEPTRELLRVAPVAASRAEAAWLEGRNETIAESTEMALDLAVRRRSSWRIGELACWRRRAGSQEEIPAGAAEPFALELRGKREAAAQRWTEIGCPYEAALALADADEDDALRRALAELHRLGARPAAAIVARRLHERGARGVARGPRRTTKANPANLTTRELEVLQLVAQGLRNADIADRLFLSRKTVAHHVSAILRKLDVASRGQAGAKALQLGIVGQDR